MHMVYDKEMPKEYYDANSQSIVLALAQNTIEKMYEEGLLSPETFEKLQQEFDARWWHNEQRVMSLMDRYYFGHGLVTSIYDRG